MRETLRVKYYLYINNMSIVIMNGINEIGRKSLSIANKIVSIGGKIKLSISRVSIKVGNTINEFIHPNSYKNKIIFNEKSTFLKPNILIISNEEKNNINNEAKENHLIDNEKVILKERQQVLKDIELPNGDLIPIDKSINIIRLCKQDALLKSKLSLINYITEIQFKSSKKSSFDLSNKFNSNFGMFNSKNERDYVKFDGYENNVDNSYLIMTNLKKNDKNTIDEVKSNTNEIKYFSEKENFKSHLIEITKDISLLDRLSDGDNSYGYVFLAKVANYLEDYNKNKEQEKIDYFNKENYLKKLVNSDYFFKLNKRINNIIYLQFLKKEQSSDENGVIENITATVNNTLNEDEKLQEAEEQKKVFAEHDKLNENNMSIIEKQHKDKLNLINNDNSFDEFLAEIDEQLSIANENKNKKLTPQELLEMLKKE